MELRWERQVNHEAAPPSRKNRVTQWEEQSTLHSPIPLPSPLARRPLLGSGHGWLVNADEASDLHLLNPVTGAHVALPPITALHHVKMGTDEQGDPAYNVYENLPEFNYRKGKFEVDYEPTILEIDWAHEFMYHRVVLSASPSAGRACIVLLLHMLHGEVSFARLGDDRWTLVARGEGTGLQWSLDLNGSSPVACKIINDVPKSGTPTKYNLVQTPAGDILQVWRLRDYVDSLTPADIPPEYMEDEGDLDPCLELNTFHLQVYKVDLHGLRVELIKSLPDYALFLDFNGSMCLPVKDFPGLKPNCVYITNDLMEYVNCRKNNRRQVGI
ncbi:uncharacterized protein [Setaria viridis]|uniref:uncharacterized protein n=1 Tax=Setaria viridis TaxID=4556 RepID=UPI0014933C17|nr:uncharacterized protein LOC117834509 [Setaria viridis]